MTYYDILNVSEDAMLKTIKNSYHQLSRKYHPDKNNGDDTMFKKIMKHTKFFRITKKEDNMTFN